jgi:hypothetical protein
MHERRGNLCIFLLKIAEKEGKTDLIIAFELIFQCFFHHAQRRALSHLNPGLSFEVHLSSI